MFLGPLTAKVIAKWIIHEQIEITHLILAYNCLGDLGLEKIAQALAINKSIIVVDLS